ncbi:MAG: TIGR02186 family protein [Hyphomicrobiaceae bacterium]|nr:TIGR02186 family protein [Hyphomicrobiaceae bacterium]
MADRKKLNDATPAAQPSPNGAGVRDRVVQTTRTVATTVRRALPELSPADMGSLLRKRNLQFGFGVALVVILIAIFRFTGDTKPVPPQPAVPTAPAAPAVVAAPKEPVVEAPHIVPRLPGETAPAAPLTASPTVPAAGSEAVEADVSTRSVAITSNFSGTEIVVFGAVDGSRQNSPEAGLYDVVVILEGTHTPIISRRKSNVAGLWINTQSVRFASLPSYYTISATRPLEEIAEPAVLNQHGIGFEHVRLIPAGWMAHGLTADELKSHREAIIRLKQKDGLYIRRDYGTVFIGRSLFRTQIALPANVPVGPLDARVFLFREGRMLSTFTTKVNLQREGIEAFLHAFAFEYSLLYGIFCVVIAVAAGLAASALFKRGAH